MKQLYRIIFILVCFLSFYSCNSQESSRDKDFVKIESEFNLRLCKNKLKEIKQIDEVGKLPELFSDFNTSIDSIKNKISQKVFNDIWIFDSSMGSYDINCN